ncbi:MAG: MCE family protein [Dehalococcoidia bacterium]
MALGFLRTSSWKGPSKTDLALRGLVYLTIMLALIGYTVTKFVGLFSGEVPVQAVFTTVGDALTPNSDVKIRGVIIGRVASIDATTERSDVNLLLDPEDAKDVPANVVARVLPATVFGKAFVDLVPSGPRTDEFIKANQVIKQDTSAEAVEMQKTFTALHRVLVSVPPARLSQALGAVSEALSGQGEKIGQLIVRLDSYLTQLAPHVPTLKRDIRLLADALESVNANAPGLFAAVEDLLVTSRTVVEKRAQIEALMSSGIALADDTNKFFTANERNFVTLVSRNRRIIDVLQRQGSAVPRGIGAFDNVFTRLSRTLQTGASADFDLILDGNPGDPYTAADCPRYPGLSGPNCGGSGAPTRAALGGAIEARTPAYQGTVGSVGSPEEHLLLAQIVASLAGDDPETAAAKFREYGDIAALIGGGLFRGTTVMLP